MGEYVKEDKQNHLNIKQKEDILNRKRDMYNSNKNRHKVLKVGR